MEHYWNHLPVHLQQILISSGLILGSLLAGLLLKILFFSLLKAYRRSKEPLLTSCLVKHLSHPGAYFIPLLVLSFMLPLVTLPKAPAEVLRRFVETFLIISFAWVLVKVVYVFEDLIRHHYQISKSDNIRERKLFTQLQFIKRLVIIGIVFISISLVLMSFTTVRRIGTGLLTSAGILSVIVGFAAQRSIGNLLAGLQLAFTQPIRIDDVLVVEGEFGRVEEITLTYVVLRIWDDRRLILPLNYFIEKPIQNWTRTTSEILATVYFHTDYTLPVEIIRQELKAITAQSKFWDGRVCELHVTDAKERTLEIRALLSATNSGAAWDLRCEVREKLITFIQEKHPDCLPKSRSVIEGETGLTKASGAV